MELQALPFPHFCVLQDVPLIRDKIQCLGDKIQYLVVKGFYLGRKPQFHTAILLELQPGGGAGTWSMEKELSKARCGMVSLQESLYPKPHRDRKELIQILEVTQFKGCWSPEHEENPLNCPKGV